MTGHCHSWTILALFTSLIGVASVHGQSGACCLDGGSCFVAPSPAACSTSFPPGSYQGEGSICGPTSLCGQFGACCMPDGTCVGPDDFAVCDLSTGTFQGDGTTCMPNSCPPPSPVPTQINHQGIVSVNGQRFTGNGNFYFAIIDPATGNSVWTNDATNIGTTNRPNRPVVIPCASGLYSVRLGGLSLANMKIIPVGVFSSENRALRIWFNDGTNGIHQLTPDHPLTSAPYAIHAAVSKETSVISFGDGSDGNVVITEDTTMTSDKYYTNLTIESGVTLYPNGFRVFVASNLTLDGVIARNGNHGGSGGNGSRNSQGMPGTGGLLADGYLRGSVGGDGGIGGSGLVAGTSGSDGVDAVGCLISSNGSIGGGGGNGVNVPFGTSGGAPGQPGNTTPSNVKLIANWHLATLLDIATDGTTVKFTSSGGASGGGGGGGSRDGGTPEFLGGGGGGGGGTNGGVIAIYARNFLISPSGSISANGGNGGNGGHATTDISNSGGGGGGGGGGNGGVIILVYESFTNLGAMHVIPGLGGVGGSDVGIEPSPGGNGAGGVPGVVALFQLNQ